MLRTASVGLTLCLALTGCSASTLSLRRVVLYQNGVGYFERTGTVEGETLSMHFASHEVDDVLGTLTVLDVRGGETVTTASVPARAEGEDTVRLDLRFPDARARELMVSYAVPTPAWRAVYRVVLPERGSDRATFQVWALVHNASAEPWDRVALTLATRAPFSFAVDLRTPMFMPRPDVTGTMVTPVLSGAVSADRGTTMGFGEDADGDGVTNENDMCPSAPEDRDGFEDEDGCPDTDNDHDRIADRYDRCPNDPETYNGMEDDDGCPDRGGVVVTESNAVILDKIYFATRAAEVDERNQPILEAIAATLIGNPQITRVHIAGHTASDEPDGWGLSAERAGAVRAALIELGVAPARLVAEPFAATQPVDARETAEARERNRRVEFHIDVEAPPPSTWAITTGSTLASSASAAEVHGPEGDVRFDLASSVSVPAHSSTLVTLFSGPLQGSAVLLYRPDDTASGSLLHPYLAAEIRLPSDLTLVPGAVAIYAGGTFAGEGLIDHAEPGELATIPFGLDETTRIEARAHEATEPVCIVSAMGESLRVEDRRVLTTTYALDPGSDAPAVLVLHHPRRRGSEPRDLPPRAEIRTGELVLGVPLTGGTASTFDVVESSTSERTVSVLSVHAEVLTSYLDGSELDAATDALLRNALLHRAELETAQVALNALRAELSDAATRTAELRANVRSVTSAELRRTLTERLREAASASERLAAQIATSSARVTELRVALTESLAGLRITARTE